MRISQQIFLSATAQPLQTLLGVPRCRNTDCIFSFQIFSIRTGDYLVCYFSKYLTRGHHILVFALKFLGNIFMKIFDIFECFFALHFGKMPQILRGGVFLVFVYTNILMIRWCWLQIVSTQRSSWETTWPCVRTAVTPFAPGTQTTF
jgi:hypothetical protein